MSDSLFKKLPEIWKDLDLTVSDIKLPAECQWCGWIVEESEVINGGYCGRCNKPLGGQGLLERFLSVPDAGIARIEDLISEFLRSHNVEKIRERFVPLFEDHTGYRWKDSKSYQWNRNRLEVAITRASYKTTEQCISDLTREHGASYYNVVDMASKVIVESKQGNYCEDDCYYFDSDYYHPGIFQLWYSDDMDRVSFEEDFQYLKPAGTKWYYRVCIQELLSVCDHIGCSVLPELYLDAGNNTYGTTFWNAEANYFEYLDWVSQGAYDIEVEAVGEGVVANSFITVNSMSILANDQGLTVQDTLLTQEYNSRQPAVEPEWE